METIGASTACMLIKIYPLTNNIMETTPKDSEEMSVAKLPDINEIIQFVDPEKEIEFGRKASKALTAVIATKEKKVMINGQQYLEFEDWQTIARFFRVSVGTDSVKELKEGDAVTGYEAKAVAYFNGQIIGSAIAECTRSERNWIDKPQFQLKSMAQTRACAKTLRNLFGWVVVLAGSGYATTPAEEMMNIEKPKAVTSKLASDKQVKLIYDLAKQKLGAASKGQAWASIEFHLEKPFDLKTLTSTDAKQIIDFLMGFEAQVTESI